MLYENAIVRSFHADVGMEESTCDVRIEGGDIVVTHEAWTYRGKEEGSGHFRLDGRELVDDEELDGRATLHRFEGASLLVGNWTLGGTRVCG